MKIKYIIVIIFIIIFWYSFPRYVPPTFQVVSKDKHSSRIGNLLDAWYYGSLGSKIRIREFNSIQSRCGENSFGNYLRLNEGVTLKKNLSVLVKEADTFWAVYKYSNIVLSMPNLRQDCFLQLDTYMKKYRKYNFKFPYNSLTIHWRLGDFIRLNNVIHYKSIIKASNLFNRNFEYIYLMDGGSNHNTNKDLQKQTTNLQNKLITELKITYPKANIVFIHTDPDLDLYFMANAPHLLVTGGSYAMFACIMNKHGKLMSPNASNTNFPSKGTIDMNNVYSNWSLYKYEMY